MLLTQHIREQSQYIVKILNTLSLTHTLSHSISLPLYHTHSLSGSVELTHTRAITAHRGDTQHTHTLSRTHTLSLSLSLSTTLLHTQGLFNQHILEQSQHVVEMLNGEPSHPKHVSTTPQRLAEPVVGEQLLELHAIDHVLSSRPLEVLYVCVCVCVCVCARARPRMFVCLCLYVSV